MNSIEQVEKTKNRFSYGQNGLFTVGLEVWKEIYEHENCGINEMVVFLSLSCGTDGEHIKSTWSINSVKKYIGLTEIPAKKALKNLIDTGFVKVIKPVLKAGDRPEYEVKNTTKENGDYIWLPNSLIVGVKGEASPINRLKKRNDKRILYYFIRLYFFQDMKETGCISEEIISASPYENEEKFNTSLITRFNKCISFLKLNYQWICSTKSGLGTFGKYKTVGSGKQERKEFEVEHCLKLNERGAWIIMRPLWDMQLIEPVFFVTDSPDEAPNDEKVFMYELFTEEQKAIADKILSGRYSLDESLSKQVSHVSKLGKFTSNIAFGFIDCDYANASIKPMFRLKYRTKNPYSKTRIRDQGKFQRELTQKAELHL
ncbi:hypothetical protein [Acinetobacter sp.]|uniref:hypothetical protein n=1 Tax=Acinetobacter sp. TaxID=472 RepID=UPI00388E9451